MSNETVQIEAGMRVRVTQQVMRGTSGSAVSVEGEVLRVGQQKTGSWFAHAKDKKLWLDRMELRRDDGELVVVNLDRYSVVEAI
ncbi:MAG: hypothetical protein KC996_00185 [Phycisphaerales bacterium]|nr:hypothetical protein [Phycisphaerales bacterium]